MYLFVFLAEIARATTMATGTIESNNRKTGEMRKFHVVLVQRQRNAQKSVMLEQSCCFAS